MTDTERSIQMILLNFVFPIFKYQSPICDSVCSHYLFKTLLFRRGTPTTHLLIHLGKIKSHVCWHHSVTCHSISKAQLSNLCKHGRKLVLTLNGSSRNPLSCFCLIRLHETLLFRIGRLFNN